MELNHTDLDQIASGEWGRILAPLPDGGEIELRIDSIKRRSASTQTFLGKIEGQEQTSDVLIVYHDGIIHGSIARYDINRHFEYRVLASGHLMIRELDSSTMTARCGKPDEAADTEQAHHHVAADPFDPTAHNESAPPAEEPNAPSDTPGYTTIDVVVGYGIQARQADGGVSQMEARIIASVDRMNLAFSNSQITNTELMLLGTIEDPDYVFPGAIAGTMNSTDELGDLKNTSDGTLDTVSDYAAALGADFKSFIVKQVDGSAGTGYLPGTSTIVARDYMTSTRLTFAHELGHNIGCRHSWGDSDAFDHHTDRHNYGWRLDPPEATRVRTIMAYDWYWGSGNRIPYFSNPDVEYLGARTGQVDGYDATGDSESDPRYISGGYIGTLGSGFDGTHPNLGARNAHYIQDHVATSANRDTRTTLAVVTPTGSDAWDPGSTHTIYWTGGDYTDDTTIGLYKGGVLQYTIASGFTAENRHYAWTIPTNQTAGTNYRIRVTLNGSAVDQSANFTINLSTPTSLTATTSGADQIDLTWSDNANGETAYEVQRANISGGPWTTLPDLPADSSSYTDTSRSTNTTYFYQVFASTSTLVSATSNQASATTWTLAEDWRNQYFGSTNNSGNAADDFDYDKDGLVNLLERAFGTHPADSNDHYTPNESVLNLSGSEYLAITYRRLKDGTGSTGVNYTADGLTYTVEASTSLTQAWDSGASVVEEVIPTEGRPDNGDGTEDVTVRVESDLDTSDQQFMQLSIQAAQ